MPNEFSRSERVAQLINRHLAVILRTELQDPRVSGLTITEVELSKDLRYAKVFVSDMMQREDDSEQVIDVLDKAKGFIRRKLASAIKVRHCPELVFSYDYSLAQGAKMNALIKKAMKGVDESGDD